MKNQHPSPSDSPDLLRDTFLLIEQLRQFDPTILQVRQLHNLCVLRLRHELPEPLARKTAADKMNIRGDQFDQACLNAIAVFKRMYGPAGAHGPDCQTPYCDRPDR